MLHPASRAGCRPDQIIVTQRSRGIALFVATASALLAAGAAAPTPGTQDTRVTQPAPATLETSPGYTLTAAVTAASPRGRALWRDPGNPAAVAAAKIAGSQPAKAALLRKIANQPQAVWMGDWYSRSEVRRAVAGYVARANRASTLLPLVIYAIPQRDCGGYSAGGMGTPAAYRQWVDQVAAGMSGARAIVILEPDALADLNSCPSGSSQATRVSLLRYAATRLARPNVWIYLDVGNAGWQSASTMA
jgi:endoglucanase